MTTESDRTQVTTCARCGARILWARTWDGKDVPLDAAPSPFGNVILEEGRATLLHFGERPPATPRYFSHLATCPVYGRWRVENAR